MTTTIETERLLLRPFTIDDVEASYQMEQVDEVVKYTGDGGKKTREQVHRLITNGPLADYQKHGYGRFAIEYKATGKFIGFCGLKYLNDHKAVDLGYRIAFDLWGKGLATEASKAALAYGFNDLHLNEVIGLVLKDNHASIRVLEKLHFRFVEDFLEDGVPAKKFNLDRSTYLKHL